MQNGTCECNKIWVFISDHSAEEASRVEIGTGVEFIWQYVSATSNHSISQVDVCDLGNYNPVKNKSMIATEKKKDVET